MDVVLGINIVLIVIVLFFIWWNNRSYKNFNTSPINRIIDEEYLDWFEKKEVKPNKEKDIETLDKEIEGLKSKLEQKGITLELLKGYIPFLKEEYKDNKRSYERLSTFLSSAYFLNSLLPKLLSFIMDKKLWESSTLKWIGYILNLVFIFILPVLAMYIVYKVFDNDLFKKKKNNRYKLAIFERLVDQWGQLPCETKEEVTVEPKVVLTHVTDCKSYKITTIIEPLSHAGSESGD